MKKKLFLFCCIGIIIIAMTKKYFIQKKTNLELNQKTRPAFYLINVLDKEAFDDAHIKSSIHVPFEEVSKFLNNIEDLSIPLIFYCSNYFCTASDAAAKMAIKRNFKNVFVYKGGMAEWWQAAQENPEFLYEGQGKADYLRIVILADEAFINEEEDLIDEETQNTTKFKIISINNLQKFLKEGRMIE